MRHLIVAILFFLTLGAAEFAHASQAEVRDVALSNGCAPKKIEIYKQAVGSGGDTLYRVQCTEPKTVAPAESAGTTKPLDALLVSCVQNLCQMVRPVAMDQKQ